MRKVLVLENEESIRSFVVLNLQQAGYETVEADTGEKALELLQKHPDIGVVLLNVVLPGIDGFEVCRRIRAAKRKIGIMMLTARVQEMDKIEGLMRGADDFVMMPFSLTDLTARVDALYRRIEAPPVQPQPGEVSYPLFCLDTRTCTLSKNDKKIKLTQAECFLMKFLMDNPGKPLSREEILEAVWGRDTYGDEKIVDVNIRRLRSKLEDDPKNPAYITTVWGYGYKWDI